MDKIVHRKKRFNVLKQASNTELAVIQRVKFHAAMPSESLQMDACYARNTLGLRAA